MKIALLMVLLVPAGTRGQCEPKLSDNCFALVGRDLDVIMEGNRLLNSTQDAAIHLCQSLQDGLSCAQDVIDADCSDSVDFDSWISALTAPANQLCDQPVKMADLLRMVQCWNVELFVQCTENLVGIRQVEDLFKKEQNCRLLRDALGTCNTQSIVSSCREQQESRRAVQNLIDTFLDASHCVQSGGSAAAAVRLTTLAVLTLLHLL